jgi:guanine deaminase
LKHPRPLAAFRAAVVHFLGDPADTGERAIAHHPDGLLVVRDGRVAECGPAEAVLAKLPAGFAVTDYRGKLILPGFVDTHCHYAQTDIIASHGEQLLAWLE